LKKAINKNIIKIGMAKAIPAALDPDLETH
jgi:hypothetical protein